MMLTAALIIVGLVLVIAAFATLRRNRGDGDPRPSLVEQIERLPDLQPNWNSYGADVPNETAMNWARTVLELALECGPEPTRVTASAEGGVGIIWIRGKRYADVECFNSGEVLAATSDRTGNPKIFEVERTGRGVSDALDEIRDFLFR